MPDRDRLLSLLDVPSGETTTHDPYGALCAMFDIAHALYWLDPNAVPGAWGFSPGAADDMDFAKCAHRDECEPYEYPDGECREHGTDCLVSRLLLLELGVNLEDPYGDEHGRQAERELIELGNELDAAAVLWEG